MVPIVQRQAEPGLFKPPFRNSTLYSPEEKIQRIPRASIHPGSKMPLAHDPWHPHLHGVSAASPPARDSVSKPGHLSLLEGAKCPLIRSGDGVAIEKPSDPSPY
jgi:hypothetical protein